VLSKRRWVTSAGQARIPRTRGAGGSAGRAAAGALRLGNALGAALSPRRLHTSVQRRLMVPAGTALVLLALVAALWPRLLAWPLGLLALWLGSALLLRAARTPGRPS
jgi:cardiolipin synthase A/B